MMKAIILGLLALGMLAGPMAANALVITISGQGSADGQWDPAFEFMDARKCDGGKVRALLAIAYHLQSALAR